MMEMVAECVLWLGGLSNSVDLWPNYDQIEDSANKTDSRRHHQESREMVIHRSSNKSGTDFMDKTGDEVELPVGPTKNEKQLGSASGHGWKMMENTHVQHQHRSWQGSKYIPCVWRIRYNTYEDEHKQRHLLLIEKDGAWLGNVWKCNIMQPSFTADVSAIVEPTHSGHAKRDLYWLPASSSRFSAQEKLAAVWYPSCFLHASTALQCPTTIDVHWFSILKYATVKFTNMMDCSTPLLLRNNTLHSTTYCWLEILFNIKIAHYLDFSLQSWRCWCRYHSDRYSRQRSFLHWPGCCDLLCPALSPAWINLNTLRNEELAHAGNLATARLDQFRQVGWNSRQLFRYHPAFLEKYQLAYWYVSGSFSLHKVPGDYRLETFGNCGNMLCSWLSPKRQDHWFSGHFDLRPLRPPNHPSPHTSDVSSRAKPAQRLPQVHRGGDTSSVGDQYTVPAASSSDRIPWIRRKWGNDQLTLRTNKNMDFTWISPANMENHGNIWKCCT